MRSFARSLIAPLSTMGFVLVSLLATQASIAAIDPATFSYWVSMRGITEDAQPSYVIAEYSSGGAYTVAFTGCADHTYYLTDANAATVQAARTSGDTVQVHRGPVGSTQPAEASVICLVQADQ